MCEQAVQCTQYTKYRMIIMYTYVLYIVIIMFDVLHKIKIKKRKILPNTHHDAAWCFVHV